MFSPPRDSDHCRRWGAVTLVRLDDVQAFHNRLGRDITFRSIASTTRLVFVQRVRSLLRTEDVPSPPSWWAGHCPIGTKFILLFFGVAQSVKWLRYGLNVPGLDPDRGK